MPVTVSGWNSAAIQTAAITANAAGGGGVYMPGGLYTINRSIDVRGMSNIEFFGDGPSTVLQCTSALNGSDANRFNNVFNANNLTIPFGSYPWGLKWRDMTIDCSAQNARGMPPGQSLGMNLCAIECQNVDAAMFTRLKIINAFGNALVSASIDPKLSAAVIGAVTTDCEFDGCVGGILPQYGITGSVIQYGAARGGSIQRCRFVNSGGPAIDWFNCFGTKIGYCEFTGEKGTPVGAGQTVNSIHSDFGLQFCTIEAVEFLEAGVIYLSGIMTPEFFNGNIPTPGPWHCTIKGAKLYGASSSNVNFPHITIIGGSSASQVGNATSNVLDNISSYQAQKVGIELVDGNENSIINSTIEQCGSGPLALLDSGQPGGGSKNNRMQGIQIIGGNLDSNYQDNSPNNTGNHLWDSRIEVTKSGQPFAAQGGLDTRGLYGPGAP